MTGPSSAAGSAHLIATEGRLRSAFNLANPTLVTKDDGNLGGVAVDVAGHVAAALDLQFEPIACESPAAVLSSLRSDDADIGFIALDPSRSDGLLCTPPYLLVEANYVVSTKWGPTEVAQVDADGVRVGAVSGTAYEAFLRRNLGKAELVPAKTQAEALDALRSQAVDVVAGIRSALEAATADEGELTVLPQRFMAIEQGVALPAARGGAALDVVSDLLRDMKATGFIRDAVEDHGIRGVVVAP